MTGLTQNQLSAQVRQWKRKLDKEHPSYFGVRTDRVFTGSPEIQVENEAFMVRECRSDLEARQVLSETEEASRKAILLFRVDHTKIGEDLISRLAGNRLFPVDPSRTLLELFKVDAIDPRITRSQALMEALISAAAESGSGLAAPVGILSLDFAWAVVLNKPELQEDPPDLVALLRWSRNEDQWDLVKGLEREIAKMFFSWVAERNGNVASLIQDAVIGQKTSPELLVPIGLCLGLLFREERNDSQDMRLTALGRLEPYLGGQTVHLASAKAWYQAATSVAEEMSSADKRILCGDVDSLLKALKADELAHESDFSLSGMQVRFARFAEALGSFLRRKAFNGGQELIATIDSLRRHALASHPDYVARIEKAEMAARLATWSKGQETATNGNDLEALMTGYFQGSSYVDRARIKIGEGDVHPELNKAYAKLLGLVVTRRRSEQRTFAESLAEWNRSPESGNILKIEDVVGEVVAPLAKERNVLLLVLDGMSCAVFSELVEDFERRGWNIIAPDGKMKPVLAALPSVTEISRKALFSGKIDASDQRSEQKVFRTNPALQSVSTKGEPVLFLKGDLTTAGEHALSNPVQKAIADPIQKVTAVLLNTVDDQLSGSDQLNIDWSIGSFRFLQQILEAAADAERALVLLSDHGNVPDQNLTTKIGERASTSDRHRNEGDPVDPENEIALKGRRIESATGKPGIIACATDAVRYTSKKAGYHGGASDMEVVAPLAVFDRNDQPPEGWDFASTVPPDWWRWEDLVAGREPESPPRKVRRKKSAPKPAKDSAAMEFDFAQPQDEAEVAEADWISALMEGEVFRNQLAGIGRTPLKKDHIQSFLHAMEKRQGTSLVTTLAADMNMPAIRLRGFVSHLRRLFNVDGYEVLSEERESQTVRFDKDLALKQFGVQRGNRP